MRLVLARSKPSRTRMRAVASIRASTVARERACAAFFLGLVSGRDPIRLVSEMRVFNTSYRSYCTDNLRNSDDYLESPMSAKSHAQLVDIKRWADRGLYDVAA